MSREQTITQYISTLLEKEGERGRFEKEAEKYRPKSGLMTNRNEPKKDEPVDTAPKVMSSSDHLFNAVEEMSRYVDDSGSDALTDSISRSVRIPNVPTSIDRRTPLVDLYRLNMGGETEQGFLKAPAAPVAPSIDTEGKGKLSFAQSMINSLRSRYQEKRINPNVKSLPEQDSITATELDGAAVGGASDGKVDEGLMSRPDELMIEPLDSNKKTDYKSVATRMTNDLMVDFDLTKTQAAALAGNLAYESANFQTLQEILSRSRREKGHKGGLGYVQWTDTSSTNNRRTRFEDFAKDNKLDVTSYAANYGYLKKELSERVPGSIENMGKNMLKKLKKADDIKEAVKIVMSGYLRPAAYGSRKTDPDAYTNLVNKRTKRANEILGFI